MAENKLINKNMILYTFMPRPENPATQNQLRSIYDRTGLALPTLVPARDEENKIFNGQVPTGSTSLFLAWGIELAPEDVHDIDPRAVDLLHVERGLEVYFFGPESRDQSTVEFKSLRDPATGQESIHWTIERHDDDLGKVRGFRRPKVVKSLRQPEVNPRAMAESISLQFQVGGYSISFKEANILNAIAQALPNLTGVREAMTI